MEKIRILDVPVSITSYEEIIDEIKNKINTNQKLCIVAINPKKVVMAKNDNKFMEIINKFDIYIPDGSGVVKANKKIKQRITGIDLMEYVCLHSNNINGKIYLYGATEDVVKKTKEKLERKYFDINIVGYSNGYVNDAYIYNEINKSDANILFVAKGSPIQEQWIIENIDKLNINMVLGVGGAFDVVSEQIKRAPLIFQKANLEWLYRMIKEPKRFKQIFIQMKYCYLLFKGRK